MYLFVGIVRRVDSMETKTRQTWIEDNEWTET